MPIGFFVAFGFFRVLRAPAIAAALVLTAATASAQLAASRVNAPPPDPLAARIKSVLSPDSVKVSGGDLVLEFWWVQALAGAGTPPSWEAVAPGTLVGAVRTAGPFREIRGRTIKPGVYTLRYGVQPQNGDHLGASPFREFLLLSPAAVDTDPKPLGVDAANAVSKQTIGQSHPAVMSLDPPIASGAVLSSYKSELDHQGIIVEVKTTGTGTLKFGLIVIGVITP